VPANRNKSKKALLCQLIQERKLTTVTEREWLELLAALAPVTESYLRRLLSETGVAVEQPFAGIRQKTLEELERSLIEMERAYTHATQSGNHARARQCRNAVIQAKDHARLAARNPTASAERKTEKQEMVRWMLVWLENPGVFPAWVKLRRTKLEGRG
jgi:hypothetical protein